MSTRGGTKTIQSAATTWKELQEDLTATGVQFEGFKATVIQTQTTLELDGAVLPTGIFSIALTPVKTKAGSMSYNEMKSYLKFAKQKAASSNNTVLVNVIGNYTHLTVAGMTARYETVVRMLEPATTTPVAVANPANVSVDRLANLEERLYQVEKHLQIVNPHNIVAYANDMTSEAEKVIKLIK